MIFILRTLAAAFAIAVGVAFQSMGGTPVSCLPPECTAYPKDAGTLNVRDFGAKGDGHTDDTAAINAALTASGGDTATVFWQDRIVYFPAGTYLVSSPVMKRYKDGKFGSGANGRFGSGAILIGESRDATVIRLKDHAEGYDNPATPKAIIFTSSKFLDSSPNKDYKTKGEGNDAYMNFVENMTVDAGNGNPGAVGVDYLANNMGAIRNVRVTAPPGSGVTGIALNRKWPGPALLKNIIVQGFNTGIDVDNTEYGLTMESVTLQDQLQTGLRNNHNMVALHDLNISNAPLPIANLSPDGLIVIENAEIKQQSPVHNDRDAIENAGALNLRAVHISGYKTVLGAPVTDSLNGVYQGQKLVSSPLSPSWSLPIELPPLSPADSPEQWANVVEFGAIPDKDVDTTAAIRKAFASGARTVYFPHGVYHINDNIVIPQNVEHIVGMGSTIRGFPESGYNREPGFSRERGMFITSNSHNTLIIEKLAFDHSWHGNQVGVEAAGTAPIFLKDVVGAGVTTLLRPEGGGKAFIEDTCCGTLSVAGKEGVWARQLNTEGGDVRILNKGAPLWILGLKSEQNCTILENSNHAKTEILGGFIYITSVPVNTEIPAFRNSDSELLVSFLEQAFHPEETYKIYLQDTQKGIPRTTLGASFPKRSNEGRIVPELSSP